MRFDGRAGEFGGWFPPSGSFTFRFTHPAVDLSAASWALWVQADGLPDPAAAIVEFSVAPGVAETVATLAELDVPGLVLGRDYQLCLRVDDAVALGGCARTTTPTTSHVFEGEIVLRNGEVDIPLQLLAGPGGQLVGAIDGGYPDSNYGGTTPIDGGTP